MAAEKYIFTKYKQWKMDSANPADEFRVCLKVPPVQKENRELFLGSAQSRALKLDDGTGAPNMFVIGFELLPAPDDQFLLQFKLKLDGDEQEDRGMWRHGARVYSGHSSTAEEIVGIGTIFAPPHDGTLWTYVASAERIAEIFKDGHINFRFDLKRDRVIKRSPSDEPEELQTEAALLGLPNSGPFGDSAAEHEERERPENSEMIEALQEANRQLTEELDDLRIEYGLLECERNALNADFDTMQGEFEAERIETATTIAETAAELQKTRSEHDRVAAEMDALRQQHNNDRETMDIWLKETDEAKAEMEKLRLERDSLREEVEKRTKERDFLVQQVEYLRYKPAETINNGNVLKEEVNSQNEDRSLKRKLDELAVQNDELAVKVRAFELEKQRWMGVPERLWEQRQREHGTDLRLLVNGTKFDVHKFVLILSSAHFERQFLEDPSKTELTIDDLTEEELEALLEFLYRGVLRDEHAVRLFELATRFEIDTLKVKCLTPLKGSLTADNIAERLVLAQQNECPELADACFEFVERDGGDRIVLMREPAVGRLIESPKPTDTDLFRRIYRAMKKAT